MKCNKGFYNIVVKFNNFYVFYNTRTTAIAKLDNLSLRNLKDCLDK